MQSSSVRLLQRKVNSPPGSAMTHSQDIWEAEKDNTEGFNQLAIGSEMEQKLIILFMSCSSLLSNTFIL